MDSNTENNPPEDDEIQLNDFWYSFILGWILSLFSMPIVFWIQVIVSKTIPRDEKENLPTDILFYSFFWLPDYFKVNNPIIDLLMTWAFWGTVFTILLYPIIKFKKRIK